MAISCDRVRDLASGFVLGALDPAEMTAVREHLGGCSRPHAELRELGGVVPYLGGSLEPVEPSARLADPRRPPWSRPRRPGPGQSRPRC
jgi:anti-sigma factor RsiW